LKTLFASLIILSSLSSFAQVQSCQVRDLSLAQQTEIKKINDEAAEKIKPLSLEIKTHRALLNRIMQNPQAIKADAENVTALISAKSLEIKAIQSEKNSIESFDILSPEQRVKKARCLAALKNPRTQVPNGRVVVRQPVRRPHYRPTPVRYPRVGRGHPYPVRHVSRRVFP
jgi:Spy/CpxP family protein refolding chaperone